MATKSRPTSYSEGYIVTLPSPPSNMVPLLLPSPTSPPLVEQTSTHYVEIGYNLALRFSLHIALISLFETVFFWAFVSKQENNALEILMNTYTSNIFSNCSSLSIDQRIGLFDLVNTVANSTHVYSTAHETLSKRTMFNDILVRDSWTYVGCLTALFGGLSIFAHIRKIRIQWAQILGENAAMIILLGMYEWMFFQTIVLRYQAISAPELNLRIVDEFYQQCRLLT